MVRSTWYDDEPGSYRTGAPFSWRWSSVVSILLVANFAVFVLQFIIEGFAGPGAIVDYFGLNCRYLGELNWKTPLILLQLFTYQFLHGGPLHIFMNMLILFFFGRELERHLGSRRFLFLYLASGVTGGVIQILVGLMRMGPNLPPVIGASGAVYGIIVYYALMWPNRTVQMFIFPIIVPIKVKWMVTFFVGLSVLYGFFSANTDGVAHLCHLGGAFFGFLFYRYEGKYRIILASSKEAKVRKEKKMDRDVGQEMDRLLAKIHDKGIHSLTDKERRFLNEASRNYRKRR
jgi:membrane associated rhomboid family serine protease